MLYLASFTKHQIRMSKSMEGPPIQDITLASIFMKLMKKYFIKVSTQCVFKILLYWFYFSLYCLLKSVCCFYCLQKTVT